MTRFTMSLPHTALLLLMTTGCGWDLAKLVTPAGQAQDIDSLTLATSAGPITAPVSIVVGSRLSISATAKLPHPYLPGYLRTTGRPNHVRMEFI